MNYLSATRLKKNGFWENLRALTCRQRSTSSWQCNLYCMALSGTAVRTLRLVLYFIRLSQKINGVSCITPLRILLCRKKSIYYPWPPNYWYNTCPVPVWQCSFTASMTRNCSFLEFLCCWVGSGWHKIHGCSTCMLSPTLAFQVNFEDVEWFGALWNNCELYWRGPAKSSPRHLGSEGEGQQSAPHTAVSKEQTSWCAANGKMKMGLSKWRSDVIATVEEFYLKRWLLFDYEQLKYSH